MYQTNTDTDADAAYKIDLTDVDTDADGDEEVTDKELLLKDQDYSPEYYLTCAEEVNKSNLIEEDYAPGSTLQLNQIKEQQYQ